MDAATATCTYTEITWDDFEDLRNTLAGARALPVNAWLARYRSTTHARPCVAFAGHPDLFLEQMTGTAKIPLNVASELLLGAKVNLQETVVFFPHLVVAGFE